MIGLLTGDEGPLKRTSNSGAKSSIEFELRDLSMCGARAAARWTQGREILRIEGAQRCFDAGSDADNSFFCARTKERNPEFTSDRQVRPANSRGTARMCDAIQLHPLHRRLLDPPHFHAKITHPRRSIDGLISVDRDYGCDLCDRLQFLYRTRGSNIGFTPILEFGVRLIVLTMLNLQCSGDGAIASNAAV